LRSVDWAAYWALLRATLGRSSPLVFLNALKRSKAVRNVFRSPGQVVLPSFLTKALEDVEIVVGSHLGDLTEPVAGLLRDLRDSELPLRMVEARLLGLDLPGASAAFEEIFRVNFPGGTAHLGGSSLTAEKTYQMLQAAMTASVVRQSTLPAQLFVDTRDLLRAQEEIRRADLFIEDRFRPRGPASTDKRFTCRMASTTGWTATPNLNGISSNPSSSFSVHLHRRP
jgi:hypothetical protein